MEDETQTSADTVGKVGESSAVAGEVISSDGVPVVGMVLDSVEKAYEYYVMYASTTGFSVRNSYPDKIARSAVKSKVFVCSREGENKSGAKRPRPERTGCGAHMTITLTPTGKYKVSEFVPDHNHQLAAPLNSEMLKSLNLPIDGSPIPHGCKNYLREHSLKVVEAKDLKDLLEYFQRKKGDNPSFHYAIQVDRNDRAVNVFWADAKSIMDYHYFGDVLCLDTTNMSGDGRPFALFLGVNHHKQIIVFGAAVLYGETAESYRWLFETFKSTVRNKQPQTILTDLNVAIGEAAAAIFPDSNHRYCMWHVHQNAVRLLYLGSNASKDFEHDFSECIFDMEDEQEFIASWSIILDKYCLKDHEWFKKIFEERESWALPYVRQIFTADIECALRVENLSALLSEFLNPDKDFHVFFDFYEKIMEQKWQVEISADYQANQCAPRIPHMPLIWQAANLYTPIMFELFRKEVELFLDLEAYNCGEFGMLSEYIINSKNSSKEHAVRLNSSDGSVQCSCRKFERCGIQCCHALKVYDLRNLKEIPLQYILKRWTKNAKCEAVVSDRGLVLESDVKLCAQQRYGALIRALHNIALKAAESIETFTLTANHSNQLLDQVERILQAKSNRSAATGTAVKDLLSGTAHNEANKNQKKRNKKNSSVLLCKSHVDTDTRKNHKVGIEVRLSTAEAATRDEAMPLTQDGIASQPVGCPDQLFAAGRLMQRSMLGQQFGCSTLHNLTGSLAQFSQQQQYLGNSDPNQVNTEVYRPDMNSMQFVGTNSQLDPRGTGQAHLPVWDFL